MEHRDFFLFFYSLVLVKNHFDGSFSAPMDTKLTAFQNVEEYRGTQCLLNLADTHAYVV